MDQISQPDALARGRTGNHLANARSYSTPFVPQGRATRHSRYSRLGGRSLAAQSLANASGYDGGTPGPRAVFLWLALFLLFVPTGATCLPKRSIPELKPTQLFTTPPTVEQLAEVLNRSNGIHSLQSNSVSVRVNNELNLSANLTWLRSKNFRMTGTVAGFKGFDLGSNEEMFWMSVRNGLSPELFFARHDQFDAQVNRRILPVSPVWLIEALGINSLDPYQLTQAPVTQADGTWQLVTSVPSPAGIYTRTLVVDPLYGLTRQVYLRDPTGRLVANAMQSDHEYYSAVQTSLPHKVKIQLIPGFNDPPVELELSIGNYVVNAMATEPGSQFAFPNTNGSRATNLVDLSNGIAAAVSQPQVAPPQTFPHASYRSVPWDSVQQR